MLDNRVLHCAVPSQEQKNVFFGWFHASPRPRGTATRQRQLLCVCVGVRKFPSCLAWICALTDTRPSKLSSALLQDACRITPALPVFSWVNVSHMFVSSGVATKHWCFTVNTVWAFFLMENINCLTPEWCITRITEEIFLFSKLFTADEHKSTSCCCSVISHMQTSCLLTQIIFTPTEQTFPAAFISHSRPSSQVCSGSSDTLAVPSFR